MFILDDEIKKVKLISYILTIAFNNKYTVA